MRNLTLTIHFCDISQSFVSATKYENISRLMTEDQKSTKNYKIDGKKKMLFTLLNWMMQQPLLYSKVLILFFFLSQQLKNNFLLCT
jgi:hypothetical protein